MLTIYRDQLEAVYRLIEKPENWRQHFYWAFNAKREKYCFCVEGALCHVLNLDPDSDDGVKAKRELDKALGVEHAAHFNDNHKHAEVLALLRSAIERAPVRSEGGV